MLALTILHSTCHFNSIFHVAFLVPAAGLIAVGYLGSSEATCVSFLVGVTSFASLMNSGFQINHIDIAPQYAGIIMGITNTAGTIPGIIGPLVAETIAHKVIVLHTLY